MTDPIRKVHVGAVVKDGTLSDREIRVVASDPTPDRVGDIMVSSGCRLGSFKNNPIVLANHNPDKPIGSAEVSVKNSRVEALITFAPPKLSATADEFCGLAKAGVLRAVSVGFNPIEAEPIKGGGVRYTEWELLELSVVTVPANPNALVLERSYTRTRSKISAGASWPRELSQQERREFDERQAVRREGLQKLSAEGLKAWLLSKYPQGSIKDAQRSYLEAVASMTLHERFLVRKEQSDFARSFDRPLTFEERQRDFAALEKPKTIGPPVWKGSNAEYCAAWRDYDTHRLNPWWSPR
jgi:HK97 family phage prohead protease